MCDTIGYLRRVIKRHEGTIAHLEFENQRFRNQRDEWYIKYTNLLNEYTKKSIQMMLDQREAQREFENYYENTNINNLEKETNND